jgi:hypothetical protein
MHAHKYRSVCPTSMRKVQQGASSVFSVRVPMDDNRQSALHLRISSGEKSEICGSIILVHPSLNYDIHPFQRR